MASCSRCGNPEANKSYCKPCRADYMREWSRAKHKADPEARRWRHLYVTYRLRQHDYQDILDRQGGGCAICGGSEKLVVDHDHSCCPVPGGGKWRATCGQCIRGVLCDRCNVGLGKFRDSSELMRQAIQYLEDNK